MLLQRSHYLIKLFFIFALIYCSTAQQYEGEYEDDDHSSYESESDGPDYSKYYAGDGGSSSAALINVKPDSGFANPAEFSSFFSPSFYAASNKQEVTKEPNSGFVNSQDFQSGFADFRASPFGNNKDFFEQAAAQQQNAQKNQPQPTDYEIKPGPSYVSHKIVPPAPKKSKYETEIDDLNKPYDSYKIPESQDEKVIPLYSGGKAKIVDPKYTPQYTPKSQNNLTPYQKYSFQTQPATLSTFASASTGKLATSPTYANYDYLYTPTTTNNDYKSAYDAAASNVNSKLQDFNNFKPSQLIKECKKVNKHAPGTAKNAKPMDCYICTDAKGIKYEECFYGQTSESNPKNYYIETSKQYKEPTQVQGYNFNRYKRYTVNDNSKDDPYEYLKKQSEKYYHNPDFGSSYKHPKSYEDDYRFGGDGEEKSSSEQVADQLLKSGENCRKVDKDGMTCTICENKKTGGNYEQCSYSTAPEEKKFAYSKERKYTGDDEPTEETESSEEQPVSNKKPQQFYKPKSEPPKKHRQQQRSRGARPNTRDRDETSDEVERIKPVNTNRQVSEYTVPKHFANIQVSPESGESDEDKSDHDEYYYVLPSQASESQRDEQRQPTEDTEDHEATEEDEAEPESHYGYYGEESKKDVEEVLAEFAKKDRSKCKKAEKNGMTCYLCTDKKGLQHEECMYVSESRPQSKYQAYHAQQETDGRDGATAPKPARNQRQENAEESKVKSVRTSRSEPQHAETKYPDFGESTTESSIAALQQGRRRPKKAAEKLQDKHQKRRARKDYSERLDDLPVEESKEDEYRVAGEKGAFSHETEPVFSKKYGVTLPKFMLDRSEGERVYDDIVKSKS